MQKLSKEQKAELRAKRLEASLKVDMKRVEFRLSQAKAALMIEQAFFASLLANLPLEANHNITTMRVDGKRIQYSPLMVSEMSLAETKFVLCHEVMHPMLQHTTRRGSRDPGKWNDAGDYMINDVLMRESIGEMPKKYPGLHNPGLVAAGKTTEGVYALLPDGDPDDEDGGSGAGKGEGWGDGEGDLDDQPGDEAAKTEAEALMQVNVAQAAQAARMRGQLPASLERLVKEILRPKVDWQSVLWRFATEKARVDTSMARPNKRALECFDMILPSKSGERMGKMVVAVDCSGSVSAKDLEEVATETRALHQQLRPDSLEVIYWDAKVQRHQSFGPDDDIVMKPIGGGGTVFEPVTRFVDEQGIEPACMVVLTDLAISRFGPPPSYPVLWVSTAGETAPWGEVTRMR